MIEWNDRSSRTRGVDGFITPNEQVENRGKDKTFFATRQGDRIPRFRSLDDSRLQIMPMYRAGAAAAVVAVPSHLYFHFSFSVLSSAAFLFVLLP